MEQEALLAGKRKMSQISKFGREKLIMRLKTILVP